MSKIEVYGAREHNLKNVDAFIPHNSLTVVTGLSGSGKSSLAFDTLFAEGQRRYIETFSAYARNFLGGMQRPDVDKITGLSPVISIEQKTTNKNPRSTVGTITEVYDYLRLLYARAGEAYSYKSGEKMVKYTEEQIVDLILQEYKGKPVYILAPLVKSRKGLGNVVVVAHEGGYVTRYAHLADVEVRKGMELKKGSRIGYVGVSGNSFAPHLHYEVMRDTLVMDPVNHLFASVTPDDYMNMLIMAVSTGQSLD